MYHRELRRTPTGRDPHISKFMERWGVEEITHGEMMNRFLNELGYESDEELANAGPEGRDKNLSRERVHADHADQPDRQEIYRHAHDL